MLFSDNIVLEILQSEFGDEIEEMAESYVMDLQPNEIRSIFSLPIDFAVVDEIVWTHIVEFFVENEDGMNIVSGELELLMVLDGYGHMDGENSCIDAGKTFLRMDFSFCEKENKFFDLELEYS